LTLFLFPVLYQHNLNKGDSMFVEIDMMAEEEDFTVVSSAEAPEEVEPMEEIDHLYMDEQLYLQSIFDF